MTERLALFAAALWWGTLSAVIGFVVPVTLHPLLLPCVPLVVGVLAGRAVGCFHRRG